MVSVIFLLLKPSDWVITKKRLWLFVQSVVILLLLSSVAYAKDFNLTKTGVLLFDSDNALTVQTAIQLAASYPPGQQQKVTRSATTWLVAELHNPTEVTDWVANIYNSSTIDYIDLYVFDGDRMLSHFSDGRLAAARRQVFSVESAFALPFQLLPGETRLLVIRTETTTYRNTTVIAEPAEEYRKNSARNAVFTLMASGSIATFITYSLFLAWQLRDLNYLLYSLHAFAHLGFIVIVYGYFVGLIPYYADFFGYKELFLNSTVPIQYLKGILFSVGQLMGALFSYRFLDVPNLPRFTKRLFHIYMAMVAVHLLLQPFLDFLIASRFNYAHHLLLSVLVVGTSIQATIRKVPQAAYILVGWSILSISNADAMLQMLGVIEFSPNITTRNPIMVALEMAIFSLAITARVRQLQHDKSNAEYANQAKSTFLATMSHEIRTPMHGVLGTVQLLSRTPLSSKQQSYVQSLDYSGKALLTVLDEILDYSKLEAGEINCEAIDFEPRHLLGSMVSLMSARAEEKGLKLTYSVAGAVPKILRGDPNCLRQVLLNLIGNAIKFTDSGFVSVILECVDDPDPDCCLRFSVTDSGIGVADISKEHLFDHFSQADSSISRRFGGTGLGLAIAKRIVEAMGGHIDVDSEEGQGSCFYFIVKLPKGDTQYYNEKKSRSVFALRSLSILVVDDIELNRQITGDLLLTDGHQVELVDSGSEALDKLSQQQFDVVLMDVHMPNMDGIEATRRLRAANDVTPVIGLTASAMPEEQTQCLVAEMNAVLSKPIDLVLLSQTMMRLTHEQPPQLQSTDSSLQLDKPLLEQHRIKLGEKKIIKLIDKFWESSEEQLNDISQALQSGDMQLVAEYAHHLAGMALSIGFTAFGQRAAEFEKAICKNHDTAVDERFAALKTSHALLFNRWQQEGFAISYSEDFEKL
ncbi:MAG: ATP-binding protein [Methylococcaceae bacterium]